MGVPGVGPIAVWAVVALALAAVSAAGRPAGTRLLVGAAMAASVALVRLGFGFAARDWSLEYVADNTRSGVGPLLRVAGLWAGPEGSLLLWTAMAAWAAVLAVWISQRASGAAAQSRPGTGRGPEGAATVATVGSVATVATVVWARRLGGALVAGYGLVMALVASPFARLDVPAVDGLGLQPVLEYPAMVWHPPLLYAGLLGLLVPMLVVGAAAASGRPAPAGARLLGPPLALLTAGLLTGALWANVELGWGGYWAWDPIESAGLVAWCCAASALHVGRGPGRDAGRTGAGVVVGPRVAVALGLAPGLAAVWATTLTRVGLVSSVHAFADRPGLRVGLLVVAGAVSAGAGALLAASGRPRTGVEGAGGVDGPALVDGPAAADGTGAAAWAGHRRAAVMVLAAAALFVAVGAYQPLVEAATTGDAVAIAGHYYSRLLWPVAMVGVGLALWADRCWWAALAGALVAVVAAPEGSALYGVALGAAGGALAGSAVGPMLVRSRSFRAGRRRGMLAHVGVGLFLVGVAGTTAGSVAVVDAPVGTPVAVGHLVVEHRSLDLVEDSATRQAVATVLVDGVEMQPRLVTYTIRGVSTSEVAWRFHGVDELQVLLVDGDAASARYQVNRLPRVGLVWLGGLLVAVGSVGLAGRRRPPTRVLRTLDRAERGQAS